MDRCIFYPNEVRTAAYFPELCGRAIVIDIGKFVTLGKYRLADFRYRARNNDAFQALAGIERLSSEICYSLGKSNAIYIFTPEQRTLADAGYAFFYHAFLN